MGDANPLMIVDEHMSAEQRKLWEARLTHSEFHRARENNELYWKHLRNEAGFQRYRLLLNLLYLHLNRLGIRPFERALLGHMAANTVEAQLGLSATALIASAT